MTAMTTIRINQDALPDEFDASQPEIVADIIQTVLREAEVKAEVIQSAARLRIDLPTVQLAKANAVLVDLKLI